MFHLGFADRTASRAARADDAQAPHPQTPDDQPLTDKQDQEELREDVNEVLLGLLPWLTSILFHVGLVLLAVFLVWSTINKAEDEDVIIPISRLSATPGAKPTLKKMKKTTQARQKSRSRSVKQPQSNVSNDMQSKMLTIGAIGGASGKASPFGAKIGADTGFKASMYGTGGNARKIAYVIDASGSLLDAMPFVINELKRSISELTEKQSFTVIFFQGENAIEIPPNGFKKATAETKQRVMAWIDLDSGNVTPDGTTNPVRALKMALRYKPQLMFLLSDNITGRGQYELDQQRLIAETQKANVSNTKINTIQFLYPDELTRYNMKATLQLISEVTGGIYKFVDGRELGIQ